MNRIFAIENLFPANKENIINNIISKLECDDTDKIFIFSKEKYTDILRPNLEIIEIPTEIITSAMLKNFVVKYIKDNQDALTNYKWLYTIEDFISLNNETNQFSIFINELEENLKIFEYDSWFSTVLEDENFVFSKFNPRIIIEIDNAEYAKKYAKNLIFAMQISLAFRCFDFHNISLNKMLIDDSFHCPIFYTIIYAANRRNNAEDKSFRFMNYYFTVKSEIHAMSINKNCIIEDFNKYIQEEHARFTAMNVDFHPDVDIRPVFAFIKEKLDKI